MPFFLVIPLGTGCLHPGRGRTKRERCGNEKAPAMGGGFDNEDVSGVACAGPNLG
jgi:hypothetical protein